jgi:hypothetical protein
MGPLGEGVVGQPETAEAFNYHQFTHMLGGPHGGDTRRHAGNPVGPLQVRDARLAAAEGRWDGAAQSQRWTETN